MGFDADKLYIVDGRVLLFVQDMVDLFACDPDSKPKILRVLTSDLSKWLMLAVEIKRNTHAIPSPDGESKVERS